MLKSYDHPLGGNENPDPNFFAILACIQAHWRDYGT